ncbi:CGNR zinc finger domain-containing protein [Streptomyces sulfonofaciens]|nr:CGNR zinc finger domain-containing protein [Streptomyces sulfonofaciens]
MAADPTPSALRSEVPAAALAVVELLNSRPHATPLSADALDDPQAAKRITGLFTPAAEEHSSGRRLTRVRELRSDLMAAVTAADADEAAAAWAAFTEHVAAARFRQVFTADSVEQRQEAGNPVVGGIALAVAELVVSGAWRRIRLCANKDCTHAFYDLTRSRTQRWHSYEVCGNRSNVAAYRARKSKAAPLSAGR